MRHPRRALELLIVCAMGGNYTQDAEDEAQGIVRSDDLLAAQEEQES